MIGSVRDAHTHPETELSLRRYIQIDGRHDLLLLLIQRIEVAHRAQAAIVIQTRIDLFRVPVTISATLRSECQYPKACRRGWYPSLHDSN